MGMDVIHYEVKRVVPTSEMKIELNEYGRVDLPKGYNALRVDERIINWLNEVNLDSKEIHEFKEFDWEGWLKDNPQYDSFEYYDYQLHKENEDHWIQLVSNEGKTILLTEGFKYKKVEFIVVEEKEIGYMRKPFRHSEEPNQVNDETLVINITNFSDEGLNGFKILNDIDSKQAEEGDVLVFNKNQLKNLKKYSCDQDFFNNSFIKNWKPKNYVRFNW